MIIIILMSNSIPVLNIFYTSSYKKLMYTGWEETPVAFHIAQDFKRINFIIFLVCEVNVDMTFILDQSGSVGFSNNQRALQFISDVIDFFQIAQNGTQVSLVTYSFYSQIQFDLDDFNSKSQIQNFLQTVPYQGSVTATALGLINAETILNPTNLLGARPLSEGIPRIAILITDGRSNYYSINEPAMNLRDSGVQVYTVGIGNIYLPELQFIASDPDPLHIFLLDSFSDAEGFVDLLSIQLCDGMLQVQELKMLITNIII